MGQWDGIEKTGNQKWKMDLTALSQAGRTCDAHDLSSAGNDGHKTVTFDLGGPPTIIIPILKTASARQIESVDGVFIAL